MTAPSASMAVMHDAALLRLAGRQHGLVTARQLMSLGSVSGRTPPRIASFRSHRRDVLTAADRTRIGLIPVTTPAWTLLDLAAEGLDPVRPGGAVDDVLVRKLSPLAGIERMLRRAVDLRLPGASVLSELVDERRRGKKPSATGLEDELLEIFRAYGLPEPERQFEVALPGGGKAIFDAAYPELTLAFEADGDAFHTGLLDRMRDGARDEKCAQIGWTVRRYSTDDIRLRPAGIADEVARLRRGAEAA